jgi:hypothetical protein
LSHVRDELFVLRRSPHCIPFASRYSLILIAEALLFRLLDRFRLHKDSLAFIALARKAISEIEKPMGPFELIPQLQVEGDPSIHSRQGTNQKYGCNWLSFP